MSTQESAKSARGLFTAENESFLLEQAIGKPTGVTVEIGGVEFDLLPLSTFDGKIVLELLDTFAALWGRVQKETATQDELIAAMGKDAARILAMFKRVLEEAAGVTAGSETFDKWFERIRLVPSFRAIMPKVAEANGFGSLIRPQTPATAPANHPTTPIRRRRAAKS